MTEQPEAPKPPRQPEPQQENTLKELAALVRTIAASADRHIGEAVDWLRSRGL